MNDEEVLRYSRQILLREVGGRGQEKLLSRRIQVAGLSEATAVAIEYLSAGGSPVAATLVGEAQDSPHEPFLELGAEAKPGARPCVRVGRGVVSYWTPAACRECFDALTMHATTRASSAAAHETGALAALIAQRIILELGDEELGQLEVRDGFPVRSTLPHCPHR